MGWLRRRWAGQPARPTEQPDAVADGGGRLQYDELIAAARGEDPALDARMRQSAARIERQHDEPDD